MFLKREPYIQLFLTPYFLAIWYFCLNKKEHFPPAAGKKSTQAVTLHTWQQMFALVALQFCDCKAGKEKWLAAKENNWNAAPSSFQVFFTERDWWQHTRKGSRMILDQKNTRLRECQLCFCRIKWFLWSAAQCHITACNNILVFLRGIAFTFQISGNIL